MDDIFGTDNATLEPRSLTSPITQPGPGFAASDASPPTCQRSSDQELLVEESPAVLGIPDFPTFCMWSGVIYPDQADPDRIY
jgi:hypothetical protein